MVMEDIKVGEYVRTNRWIGKIEEIKTTYVRMNGNHDKSYKLDIFKSIWFTRKDFIKHSFNIIDLIEVGDLIEVQEYNGEHKWIMLVREEEIGEIPRYIKDDRLKVISILTKEQFDRERYIVGG